MKKTLWILLVLLGLTVVAIYIFIPKKLIISGASTFHASRDGVYRFLTKENNWKRWWPGTISRSGKSTVVFSLSGYDFRIERLLYDVIQLRLFKEGDSSMASLSVVPFDKDSMGIELSSQLDARSDPVSRVSAYLRARNLKKTLDDIVSSLSNYASNVKNIYGVNIQNEKVQYDHVLSTTKSFSHYPTTGDIYGMIARLRSYIQQSGANELFSPMLNIKTSDSTTFTAQVGMPVDREVAAKDDISLKWMMKGGNILTGEVTGGQKEIEEAQKQMELYIMDYQRSIIAIPFQMLITDRTREPDSTKWITRLYYPVV